MTSENNCTQSAFCAALLDPGLPCPPGLVAWNGSDPTPRLAVYRNNVVSSLIDALAQTFPVVQQLVGVPFFRAMAAMFVRQAPPRSRVLARYGEAFPTFIEQFEPARPVPYLADVARLEMARVQAYHAADAEPVAAAVLSAALAGGDRIGELRIVCHPSVAMVGSAFAVASLWSAHQGEGNLGDVDPDDAEAAMVLRDGLDVLVLRVSPGAAEFVAAVLQGRSLDDATGAAMNAESAFDLPATLGLLMGHGAITSIHFPGDNA
ncbi:DNA-binding domain-containing protein [Piscinibacter sp.]|uniref:HvfC/BufC N-terminal domain-containing protein n=1 Tax=Piscinibacter sp. TaxID=1903157 RepID=UPI002C1137F6|nr:DNA-binding domain-containing protein [Albitalea sp.]HUG25500.1 DNA-binding domain-containing protein [Albitalea sp.]